jgi:hypothetical protein
MDLERPYRNYELLVETKEYLVKEQPITREWYDFHRNLILQYADIFPKCMELSQMDDPVYSEAAENAEAMLAHLKDMIEACNIFPPHEYLCVVDLMIDVIDRFMEMEELEELMQSL